MLLEGDPGLIDEPVRGKQNELDDDDKPDESGPQLNHPQQLNVAYPGYSYQRSVLRRYVER